MNELARRLSTKFGTLPCAVAVHAVDGRTTVIGDGEPSLSVHVRTNSGANALMTLDQLAICEAYIKGDLDLDGDLVAAMSFAKLLTDSHPWVKIWRSIAPLFLGRGRSRLGWIAKHYDQKNVQLAVADADYHAYTPGIYEADTESLEIATQRKMEDSFTALNLEAGDTVLDVGCGWGGFIRFCAARRVNVTGITLSRDQFEFVRTAAVRDGLSATVLFQDFFSFAPPEKYDGIAMMGVIEHLSDYGAVIRRVAGWLKPRGRIYFDFAACRDRFGTSSFITKHIWPGTFRMVYMPELMAAVAASPFELVRLVNDRQNYWVYAQQTYRKWMEQKHAVVARSGEELWRTFRILYAGAASMFGDPSTGVSAFRMVLELPA